MTRHSLRTTPLHTSFRGFISNFLDTGHSGYVFTREDGHELDPEDVTRYFRQAVKKALLPSIRLHDLRHTHATLALRAGIHPKVVSERLGHATVAITPEPARTPSQRCRKRQRR